MDDTLEVHFSHAWHYSFEYIVQRYHPVVSDRRLVTGLLLLRKRAFTAVALTNLQPQEYRQFIREHDAWKRMCRAVVDIIERELAKEPADAKLSVEEAML